MSEFGGISLYWGITHSLVMDFEMKVILDVHFPEVILYEFEHFASSPCGVIFLSSVIDFGGVFFYSELPHFEMMYSYWGIATSLIFDVET